VLVVVDTLRADHLSAYGYARPTSPALAAQAREGALFEHAFAPSPWTLPSFASLYTGLFPEQHGAGRARDGSFAALDRSVEALAERLAGHGFATAAVANNPFLSPAFGLARGFQSYQYVYGNVRHQPGAGQVIWAGLRWLDARDPERPFLLVLHCFDPHLPYDAPRPARGAFAPESAGALVRPFTGVGGAANAGWMPRDPAERSFAIGSYDEELLFVDQQLPHLFAGLAERGLARETLVVLTADHGEELFDHGGFEHGHTLHQELLHVPLVLWGPGVVPQRIEAPVSLVDVAPTLLDALGLPPLARAAGVSLWPLVTRGEPLPARDLHAGGTLYGPARSAVVRWPWKLVAVEGGAPALYDLASDPGEARDLAAADPERVRALAALLPAPAAGSGASAPSLDARTREQLRELGYAR